MPHRKGDSPFWYLRPMVTMPGRGRVRLPERSSGSKVYAVAKAMESTLQELPIMGYADLVESYETGDLTAEELHVAKINRRLDDVRRKLEDPPLVPLLEAFEARTVPANRGVRRLPELIETVRDRRGEVGEPRLSWILDPENVSDVLEEQQSRGLKRNSVRRSELRGVADFLKAQSVVSEADRLSMMSRLDFPAENDERDVFLDPDELRLLLTETCDPLFREAVCLALSTGIDRSPLLRIVPRDFQDGPEPVLQVRDTKADSRRRALELGESAAAALRRAIQVSGAGRNDRVFPWTVDQFRYRWDLTRERADLEHVRFKDLRGIFATYFLMAGGSVKDLQQILGHSQIQTTLRYVKRLPQRRAADMTATEKEAGLRVIMGVVA